MKRKIGILFLIASIVFWYFELLSHEVSITFAIIGFPMLFMNDESSSLKTGEKIKDFDTPDISDD